MSKTNDTYVSGVSKVINQLTLGVVNLGGSETKKEVPVVVEGDDVVGDGVSGFAVGSDVGEEAHFDGYVEISTNERTHSWEGALAIWSSDARTMLVGIGLGGAPTAMYVNGFRDTPREIINNEYISLLLESGVVGVLLMVVTLGLVVRAIGKSPLRMVLAALIVAYMVSLCFFSGLPNALHIYLIPVAIYAIGLRKKLVS